MHQSSPPYASELSSLCIRALLPMHQSSPPYASELSSPCIRALIPMHQSSHPYASELSSLCIRALIPMHQSSHPYASELSSLCIRALIPWEDSGPPSCQSSPPLEEPPSTVAKYRETMRKAAARGRQTPPRVVAPTAEPLHLGLPAARRRHVRADLGARRRRPAIGVVDALVIRRVAVVPEQAAAVRDGFRVGPSCRAPWCSTIRHNSTFKGTSPRVVRAADQGRSVLHAASAAVALSAVSAAPSHEYDFFPIWCSVFTQ